MTIRACLYGKQGTPCLQTWRALFLEMTCDRTCDNEITSPDSNTFLLLSGEKHRSREEDVSKHNQYNKTTDYTYLTDLSDADNQQIR